MTSLHPHRSVFLAAALAATAALLPTPAAAQGIFTLAGNAGQEFSVNWPVVLGAITFALGPLLVIIGLFLLYKDRKMGSHGHGTLGWGLTSIAVGCCMLGIVAFATAGTFTFTGGAPTGGSGAAVAF